MGPSTRLIPVELYVRHDGSGDIFILNIKIPVRKIFLYRV